MPPHTTNESGEPTPSANDFKFLRQTFLLAKAARRQGRHPFAAIVVDSHGKVVAKAKNNSLPPQGDPTQHAEVLAAATAARLLTVANRAGCTLYSSAEPCCMCSGAIYWCGIGRVVYGLSEEKLLGFTGNNPENPTLRLPCRTVFEFGQHTVQVLGPFLETEAAEAHKTFWS